MIDIIGKSVITQHGSAIIERYFPLLKCWRIVYPDLSLGWVNETQFTLVD
jgi:hypothetical protein